MLVNTPSKYRRARRPVGPAVTPPPGPVVPLQLVGAAYDTEGPQVTLTFDRAVDTTGFDSTQVVVMDGPVYGRAFAGTGPVAVPTAAAVVVSLARGAAYVGQGVTLDASATTGVRAADDGGTWAGVTGYVIPSGQASGGGASPEGVDRVAA